MTVTTETNVVSGDGRTGSGNRTFRFTPIVIYAATDLIVTKVDTDGTETTLTLSSASGANNYTVDVTSFPGTGNVIFPSVTDQTDLADGEKIYMRRRLPHTQTTKIENRGNFLPATHGTIYDKLQMQILDLKEQLDRTFKTIISDSVSGGDVEITRTASQYLRWNSDADGVDAVALSQATASASDATPVAVNMSSGTAGSGTDFSRDDHRHLQTKVTLAKGGTNATTAAGARTSLAIPGTAVENTFTESQIWFKGADVASTAGVMTLGAGNWFDISGSNTITGITSIGVGTLIILHFDADDCHLTHHATDMVLQGSRDFHSTAGDIMMLYEFASGDWREIVRTEHDDQNVVHFFEDFLGASAPDGVVATAGGGTGNSVALVDILGGAARLTTASDIVSHASDASAISGALNWQADEDGLFFEARCKVDDITTVAFFIGVSDVGSATVELPLFKTSGADTIDSDAADACGIGFDTQGTTDEFWVAGTDGGVDTAATHSSSAPVNATYFVARIEVSSAGAVSGYINDALIGTVASAVSPDVPLTWYIACANRTTSARNFDIDYVHTEQHRG